MHHGTTWAFKCSNHVCHCACPRERRWSRAKRPSLARNSAAASSIGRRMLLSAAAACCCRDLRHKECRTRKSSISEFDLLRVTFHKKLFFQAVVHLLPYWKQPSASGVMCCQNSSNIYLFAKRLFACIPMPRCGTRKPQVCLETGCRLICFDALLFLGSSVSAYLRIVTVTLHIYLNILKIKMLLTTGASGKWHKSCL